MARRRRRKSNRVVPLIVVIVLLSGGSYYRESWLGWVTGRGSSHIPETAVGGSRPVLSTDRPEDDSLDGGPYADAIERGSDKVASSSPEAVVPDPEQASALLQSARNALAEGDPVLARAHFSEAMNLGLSPKDELETRTQLRKLGHDTIFSGQALKGDPFSSYYVIKPGDNLQKIAKAHAVTPELLARINHIEDPNRITAGHRIKVVEGPFHVRISKTKHMLDVYLGNTFIDHFKVGLGAEDATPAGEWIVKSKLINPTYYPPRGGKIIAADDPANPLAERWIGLQGTHGEALGQMRYGIHGTIDPDSIGKNASMGCIRMYNEDVAFLFDLLTVKRSTVDIRD